MLNDMVPAFVALGSNLGRRQTALRDALRRLDALPGCHVVTVANFRETAPVDAPPGSPNFMNSVAQIDTQLTPLELLAHLHDIERLLGRDRANAERNAPRRLDLDLLLVGREVVATPELTLPHPRMWKRRFVLEPLLEIAPDLCDPVSGRSARSYLDELNTTTQP
jgi:2-amino-4-hydroxy-6-hydroxymethyldihydropteridine diphosphokinase